MALIRCPECNKEISDSAKKCPNCGYPIYYKKNKQNVIKLIISLTLIIFIILVVILIKKRIPFTTSDKTDETNQADYNLSEIEIEGLEDTYYIDNEYDHISFKVTNMTKIPIHTITISVSFCDASGNVLYSTYPQVPDLIQPGQSINIEATAARSYNSETVYVTECTYFNDDSIVSVEWGGPIATVKLYHTNNQNSESTVLEEIPEEDLLTDDEIKCLDVVLKKIESTYGSFTTKSVDIATLHNPEVDEIYDQEIYIIKISIDTSVISNTYYLWSDTHAFSALVEYPAILEEADVISEKTLNKSNMRKYGLTVKDSSSNYNDNKSESTSIQLNGAYKNTSSGMIFTFDNNNISITEGNTSLKGTYKLEEGFLKITLSTGDYYSYKYSSTQNGFDLKDQEGTVLSFEK